MSLPGGDRMYMNSEPVARELRHKPLADGLEEVSLRSWKQVKY